MKLPLSSFPPVNSQSVLRNLCMFISDIFFINEKQLTHINEVDKSFFHDLIKIMQNFIPERQARPMHKGHHVKYQQA